MVSVGQKKTHLTAYLFLNFIRFNIACLLNCIEMKSSQNNILTQLIYALVNECLIIIKVSKAS